MRDIAKRFDHTKPLRPRRFSAGLSRTGELALICLCVAGLSGCMGTGLGLADASGVDPMKTASIPPAERNPAMVDAAAVSTAVSTADVSQVAGNPVPWANAQSGSAGVISSIEEEAVGSMVCRRFTTTRHSYQGIAKFDGNACRTGAGPWTLTSFAPRS